MIIRTWTIFASVLASVLVLYMSFRAGVPGAQEPHAGLGGTIVWSAVYRVFCPDRDRVGTAFGHRSGRILTAAHVVDGCDLSKLMVIAPSDATTRVSSAVAAADVDLALLTPTITDFVKAGLLLFAGDSLDIGTQVTAWGFPEGYGGSAPLLSVGYLAGSADVAGTRKWVVNGAFNGGNSGGPLLETKGATVIGVISSKHAPMPKDLEVELESLEKKGSREGKRIARILQHLRRQTQLVIGFATVTNDLRVFLRKHGVEP